MNEDTQLRMADATLNIPIIAVDALCSLIAPGYAGQDGFAERYERVPGIINYVLSRSKNKGDRVLGIRLIAINNHQTRLSTTLFESKGSNDLNERILKLIARAILLIHQDFLDTPPIPTAPPEDQEAAKIFAQLLETKARPETQQLAVAFTAIKEKHSEYTYAQIAEEYLRLNETDVYISAHTVRYVFRKYVVGGWPGSKGRPKRKR